MRAAACCCLIFLAFLPSPAADEEESFGSLTDFWETMDEIQVVTAARNDEDAALTSATTYVITAEEIRRFGFRFLQDALQLIPSCVLYDPQSWVWGGQRGLVSNFSQTLILVNGREFNNIIAGEAYMSRQYSLRNVARIEVLAGPGSALYGANALGGVINIITKDADPNHHGSLTSVEMGSYQTQGLFFSHVDEYGHWRFSVDMGYYQSEEADFSEFVLDREHFVGIWPDFEAARLGNAAGYENDTSATPYHLKLSRAGFYLGFDGYRNRQGVGLEHLSFDYSKGDDFRVADMAYLGYEGELKPDTRLKVELQRLENRFWGSYQAGFWPVARLQASDQIQIFNIPETVVASDGTLLHGDAEIREYYPSFVSYLYDQGLLGPGPLSADQIQQYTTHIFTNRNSPGSSRDRFEWQISREKVGSTLIFGMTLERSAFAGLAVTDAAFDLGADTEQPLDSDKRAAVYDSEKIGVYAAYKRELIPTRLWANLGFRWDRQSHYGSDWNPRFSLVWQPTFRNVFRFVYGEAFREPNVFELSADPDLEPAKLQAYELSWRYASGPLRSFLSLYRNKVVDFIGSVGSVIGNRIGTVDSQIVEGLEAKTEVQHEKIYAFLSGTYLFEVDQVLALSEGGFDQQPLLGLPEHKFDVGLSYELNSHFTYSLLYQSLASYQALDGNAASDLVLTIPRSESVKATVSWQDIDLGDRLKLSGYLTFNNLLDQTNRQANIRRSGPRSFLLPGRNVQLSFVLHF